MGEFLSGRNFVLLLVSIVLVVGVFLFAGFVEKSVAQRNAVRENAENVLTGYAVHSSYSAFSAAESGFVFNNSSGLVSVSDSIVYRKGYFSVNGSAWQSFSLAGSAYSSGSSWLRGSASYSLPSFGVGEHYVIVYSCSYDSLNAGWDCHGDNWQLVVVNNSNFSAVVSGFNCSDGLLNGDESGVDCGGGCVACAMGNLTVSNGVGGTSFGNSSDFSVSANRTITAVAGSGYSFVNWSKISGDCSINTASSSSTTVQINSGWCYVQANFVLMNSSSANYTRIFYVSNDGNDSNAGNSSSGPWKTINKVNTYALFQPGDAILFERGDLWRETLFVPRSGNASNYLTFGAYGTGDKPKLYGSNISALWTDQGSNIWKSSTSFSLDPFNDARFYSEIFFVETNNSVSWGTYVTNTSNLNAEYQWTWSGNYIYVYATSNPASKYNSVEIPQREYVINVGNTNQYIEIDGLDIRYATSINVDDRDPDMSLSGFTIKNCHIAYVGSRTQASGYNLGVLRNNLLIQNNDIHDGGRRIVSIHAYDVNNAIFSNFTIEGNYLHEGYHGSGFGINMDGSSNYGNTFQNIIIRNNTFYDNMNRNASADGFDTTEQGTFRVEQTGGTIKNIQVYNNIFMYPLGNGLWIENVDNVSIYHNIFYEYNDVSGLSYGGAQLGFYDPRDVSVKNNIFYGRGNYSVQKYNSIYIQPGTNTSELEIDYNLFYQVDPNMKIVRLSGPEDNYGINCLYCNDWTDLYTDYNWQEHDPGIVDPLFVDSDNRDFHLQSGSPAISAGIDVVGVTADRDGVVYSSPPSIGVYEYD